MARMGAEHRPQHGRAAALAPTYEYRFHLVPAGRRSVPSLEPLPFQTEAGLPE